VFETKPRGAAIPRERLGVLSAPESRTLSLKKARLEPTLQSTFSTPDTLTLAATRRRGELVEAGGAPRAEPQAAESLGRKNGPAAWLSRSGEKSD
jgi:hypothetical protein